MLGTPGTQLPIVLVVSWPFINLVPGIAMTVRRLHDTGRSGLHYLFVFIPLAGAVILLVLMLSRTRHPHENRFGYRRQVQ